MVISSQNKNKKETADDHIIKGFYIRLSLHGGHLVRNFSLENCDRHRLKWLEISSVDNRY